MNTVISFLLFSSLLSQASAIIGTPRKINYVGCNPAQQEQIKEAATNSDKMVGRAKSYLAGLGSNRSNKLYTDSFGPFDKLTSPIVKAHFDVIENKATLLTYDCIACTTSDLKNNVGLYTYVDPEKANTKINLCDKFWHKSTTGSIIKSQADVILRDNLILHNSDIKAKIVNRLGTEIEVSGVADLPEYSEPWNYVRFAKGVKPNGFFGGLKASN